VQYPHRDVATLKMSGAVRLAFTGGRDLYIHDTVVVLPAAERKLRVIQVRSCLNHYARQYLDLYAMIVPYRVNIIDK
jgi:hypothetical protein